MGLVVLRVGARRVWRLLLLVGLVFAALPAGSALADTTIGQVGGDRNMPCSALTVVGDTNYVVPPGGGMITSFFFQSLDEGQQLDFLVLRPAGGSDYTVVGKTGLETLEGSGGAEVFPASIAVKGGDILGLWIGNAGVTACFHAATTGGAIQTRQFAFDPGVGTKVSFAFMDPSADLNESATLAPSVGAPPPPTSKNQCKHGGWDNFGSRFKNQGQCVSFVEHQHHKHHPGG